MRVSRIVKALHGSRCLARGRPSSNSMMIGTGPSSAWGGGAPWGCATPTEEEPFDGVSGRHHDVPGPGNVLELLTLKHRRIHYREADARNCRRGRV